MQFNDLSPSTAPSLDQQRDALQKGLGRAMQWAKAGTLASEPLLDACLTDQRFDIQCEDNRGDWIWNLIRMTGRESEFRGPILDALRNAYVERDAYQLSELAYQFAQSGNSEFVKQLYEFVERRQIADSQSIGFGQLLALDGEFAMRFLVRFRGECLASEDWEWYDDALIDQSIDVIGEQRVNEILNETSDPNVLRFAAKRKENLKQPIESELRQQNYSKRMQAISAGEAIQTARSEDRAYWLSGWGMHANENDLEQVLEWLWTEQNPTMIVKMLRVFSRRQLPQFDSRLIELYKHSDDEVRRWTLNALEPNSNPLVREFALQQLRERTLNMPVVKLFVNNYLTGDERLLLDQLDLPEDSCQRHWMLMDLIHVLEKNEEAECCELGQIIYFYTPCQNCRFYAARLFHGRHKTPGWLVEECLGDANEDCQKLFQSQNNLEDECSE
jgi:hypothetical protein